MIKNLLSWINPFPQIETEQKRLEEIEDILDYLEIYWKENSSLSFTEVIKNLAALLDKHYLDIQDHQLLDILSVTKWDIEVKHKETKTLS